MAMRFCILFVLGCLLCSVQGAFDATVVAPRVAPQGVPVNVSITPAGIVDSRLTWTIRGASATTDPNGGIGITWNNEMDTRTFSVTRLSPGDLTIEFRSSDDRGNDGLRAPGDIVFVPSAVTLRDVPISTANLSTSGPITMVPNAPITATITWTLSGLGSTDATTTPPGDTGLSWAATMEAQAFTLTTGATTGDIVITFTSSDPAAAPAPAPVTIRNAPGVRLSGFPSFLTVGVTSGPITMTPDISVHATITWVLEGPGAAGSSTEPNGAIGVEFQAEADGAIRSQTFRVTRGADSTGDLTVFFTSNAPLQLAAPPTLVFGDSPPEVVDPLPDVQEDGGGGGAAVAVIIVLLILAAMGAGFAYIFFKKASDDDDSKFENMDKEAPVVPRPAASSISSNHAKEEAPPAYEQPEGEPHAWEAEREAPVAPTLDHHYGSQYNTGHDGDGDGDDNISGEQFDETAADKFWATPVPAVNDTGFEVPPVVRDCVEWMMEKGLETEGVFRIPASKDNVERLLKEYNAGARSNLDDQLDAIEVAGLLKLWAKQSPIPPFPTTLYDKLCEASRLDGEDPQKLEAMSAVLEAVPQEHYEVVEMLVRLFHAISQNWRVNKMKVSNMAMVYGPTYFHKMGHGEATEIMSYWIANYDALFGRV